MLVGAVVLVGARDDVGDRSIEVRQRSMKPSRARAGPAHRRARLRKDKRCRDVVARQILAAEENACQSQIALEGHARAQQRSGDAPSPDDGGCQ